MILALTLGKRLPHFGVLISHCSSTTCHLAGNISDFWLFFMDSRFHVAFFLEVLSHFVKMLWSLGWDDFFQFYFFDPDTCLRPPFVILGYWYRMGHLWISLTKDPFSCFILGALHVWVFLLACWWGVSSPSSFFWWLLLLPYRVWLVLVLHGCSFVLTFTLLSCLSSPKAIPAFSLSLAISFLCQALLDTQCLGLQCGW